MKFGLSRFFCILFCTTVNSSTQESKCVSKQLEKQNMNIESLLEKINLYEIKLNSGYCQNRLR